jgi:hypothetical protein
VASPTDTEASLSALVAENATLRDAVEKLQQENARLSDQLTVMMNRLFNKKSERIGPNQSRLFPNELDANETHVPLPEGPRKKKSSKGHGRVAFPHISCAR